jgi:hypothetical protein
VFGIGIVFFRGLAGFTRSGGLRSQSLDYFAEQKTGALIEADDGEAGVVGAGIKCEQDLQAVQVLPVDLPDTPLALQVRP